MLFDTHTHLNFSRFKKNVDEVVQASREVGVDYMVVPGTDTTSSEKALVIAQQYEGIFAAVGVHPHHVYEDKFKLEDLEAILKHNNNKIVAIGEIGLDRHVYEQTKYEHYHIDDAFVSAQKDMFLKQIELAQKYNKSVIVHNREAKEQLFEILHTCWDAYFEGRMVFHCCEPDHDLLDFARSHKIFIGVDGDVTYSSDKQAFIKNVPLEMLVLETDSPFLLPEPLRSQKKYPNTPANMPLIAQCVSELLGKPVSEVMEQTTANAISLFRITPDRGD